MYKKLFPLIIVLLFSVTIASTSHANWLQEFNVSGFGNFNGLTAYVVQGSTVFADIQNGYFHNYDGANGWAVDPKQNTSLFDATTGTFHTRVDFNVYFSEPSATPFSFDLEVWYEPSAINPSFPGYETFDRSQPSVLLAIIHYAWNGSAWSSTTTFTPPPLAPTNVQASDGSFTDRVQVTWTPSSGATSYEVWRNTVGNSATSTQIALFAGSTYNDTTAVPGTNYYYWLKATNPFGTSDFSAPDTGFLAVTPPSGNLLTVAKTGTGGGMIMSSVPGINCGPDCSEIYDAGASVTLTANSDATSRFWSWTDCDSVTGNQCTVSMTSNKTVTANFSYRRLDILDIAVYNGSLTGLFTVFPGFRDLLQSATLTGPGVSYEYNLQNDTLRWLSECRYLDGWTKSFGSFGYGEYTLTLNFYDGATETHKKNLQSKTVIPVDAQSIIVNVSDNGSANLTWTAPLTGQYYGVRVRSADGSIEYFRSPAQLDASSLFIQAQSLGCLERGQIYRWLVRAYNSPEMGYEGSSTHQAVETNYIEFLYNPPLSGQRATTYMATDWDGNLTLGFDVRPGSRGEVTQATVTGPNGLPYSFDLSADFLDLSTATRTNKLWWKRFDQPLVNQDYGTYSFEIVFSDDHTDTLTKTLVQVPITPVDSGMTAMIQPNGAIGFNWALPQGVSNPQYYVVRIRSLDGTKEYYSSPRLVNQSMVFASFWELRGLEHCKSYQWFVRAYDQFDNTMRQSSSQTFSYNPFNISCGDTTPPSGSILINGDAAYTNSTSVTLTLSASDTNGVSEMCISNSPSCTLWETYSPPTKPWTLSSGDGTKNVYAWFKDGLGNPNTVPYSDSITLDTTPPIFSSFSAVPGNAQVALTWSGSDVTSGIGNYTLIYSITGIPNSCSDGIQIYGGSNTSYIHIGLTNGATNYYRLCATDNVGNTSLGATVSATPTSIDTPPLPPTNVLAGEGLVGWIQVNWTGSFGAMSYEVWRNTVNDPGTATQIASSFIGTSYNDTTATTGTKYYYWVKAKNPFGTSGFSAPDTGYRGTTPPPGNLLTVMQMGTGGGMIMSSVPGINCVPDCSEIYDAGTSVILTPNPNNTSRFTGWSGYDPVYDSVSGNQCTVNMTAGKTVTASFEYRRLDIFDLAVYNGNLSGLFSVFPGFRDLLQSATLTGPGVSYGYNLQNDTQRWLSECRYLDGWITSFSSFGYDEYTLTLTFYDGVTETYKKNLQSRSVTAVATQSITINILSDGSANVAWSPPLTGQYYGVRVRSADGSVEYSRSPAQLNASSLTIPAQSLGCLVRGQSYRWLVRAYNSPEMSYEGASTFQAVATSYIELPYNPSLPGQRTTTYTATDWDGKLMLGFDVRPGSRGVVTQASVTGPNGFSYQFDLSADKIDFSTATRTNKLWWKHFNPPFEHGDYIFQIVFSDGHTDTLTKTLIQVPITPVTTGMAAAIQPNGAVRFNWTLPSLPPEMNQSYEVRIRSLDGTKEYYSSSRLVNQSMVFASFWELRGLEHCKSYQWFVRAYDQFSNTMCQSSSQTFFYNPFNLPYHTLTVTKTGSGTGTVTSSPAGVINCIPDCSESYVDGTPPVTLTLTATPSSGSVFTGWSGACSATGPCIVTVSSNTTVTANFILDTDGDGIDDAWEGQYCGGNCDPSADLDDDGLTNLQEYQIRTDPSNHDSDEDGLWDSVDEQPITPSNDFRDAATTYGSVINRGDQLLHITDELDPDGVRIYASGGNSPAEVSVCGSASISLHAGNEVVVTCGSVEIEVLNGIVDIIFTGADGTTATTSLNEGNGIIFEPTIFTITAPPTNSNTVVVSVEGDEISLIPGGMFLTIDIKPGSDPNSISLKSKGTIPVAILSAGGFDAPSSVDRNSLTFGRFGTETSLEFCSPSPKDINNDGLADLICHFTVRETGFKIGDTEGILKGKKLDSSPIEAKDRVRIVP